MLTRAVPSLFVAILRGHLPVAEEPHPMQFVVSWQNNLVDDGFGWVGQVLQSAVNEFVRP